MSCIRQRIPRQRSDEPFRIGEFDIGEPAVNGVVEVAATPASTGSGSDHSAAAASGVSTVAATATGTAGQPARVEVLTTPRLPMIPWRR